MGLAATSFAIIVTDGGEFNLVGRTGDPGDIAVTGGQGFIISVQRGGARFAFLVRAGLIILMDFNLRCGDDDGFYRLGL